jgi:hypothetical protein
MERLWLSTTDILRPGIRSQAARADLQVALTSLLTHKQITESAPSSKAFLKDWTNFPGAGAAVVGSFPLWAICSKS